MQRAFLLALVVCGLAVAAVAQTGTEVLQIHGSGDGVATYEINKVMDLLASRTKPLVYLTFRSAGTPVAQTEFLGNPSAPGLTPYCDFAMGDIPLTATQYQTLTSNNATPLHVPFVLAKISFFSTVPASALPGSAAPLYLSACTLAKIYSGAITSWSDPAILADNPGLVVPNPAPAFRVYKLAGFDAATRGITKYFTATSANSATCPGVWNLGITETLDNSNVASVVAQPDTLAMLGSLNASDPTLAWSLGYIDSNEGLAANLTEVALMNGYGNKLTSSQADSTQVATALSVSALTPYPLNADWSTTAFQNNAAAASWPIVVVSYFYVRQDSSFLGRAGGLLSAFLTLALSDEVQPIMAENGLVSLLPDARAFLLQQLNGVPGTSAGLLTLNSTAPVFTFENATTPLPIIGQANYVVSALRTRFETSELWDHETEFLAIQAQVQVLQTQMQVLMQANTQAQAERAQINATAAANAANAAQISTVQNIAIAGVVLSVIIGTVALVIGAVYVHKTKALDRKMAEWKLNEWIPGRHDQGGRVKPAAGMSETQF